MSTESVRPSLAICGRGAGIGVEGEKAKVMTVAILFARRDSIYKTLPGCDVWDAERDALRWPGGCSVVAHPPCAAWGQMSHLSNRPESERQLAVWAVEQVRTWGGVLEHPSRSKLWAEAGLPKPGERDAFGGFTLVVSQWWWGHKADKLTWLYVVGIEPENLPAIPYRIGEPEYVLTQNHAKGIKRNYKPEIPKPEREHTPIEFAKWLVEVARLAGMQT